MKEPIVIIPLSIAKSICDSWKYGVSVDSDDMQVMRKAIEAAERMPVCMCDLPQLAMGEKVPVPCNNYEPDRFARPYCIHCEHDRACHSTPQAITESEYRQKGTAND